jgi:hypothetical protein
VEIIVVIIGLLGIGFLLFGLLSTKDVDTTEEVTEVIPNLPTGSAPIVRRKAIQSSEYDYEDDGFATSMIIGAATDNALLGAVVGGNLAGGLIGQAIADSNHTVDDSSSSQDDSCSSDSSDSSNSSCDSSSSDSSSYDSGSSDSGSSSSGSDY